MAYKILLADDSPTIRKVVELTFIEQGIDVYSVGDGDSAMKKFVEIEPDLLIADVNMPGMSGYRLCEMIKQDETTKHIPVILLVGSFEPFDPGEASRVGSNYYFTKPFRSIGELVEKVTEYLEFGGLRENLEPETDDIEDLYNSSFEATVEMPRPEVQAAEFAVESEVEEPPRLDETETYEAVGADHGPELYGAAESIPEQSEAEAGSAVNEDDDVEIESAMDTLNSVDVEPKVEFGTLLDEQDEPEGGYDRPEYDLAVPLTDTASMETTESDTLTADEEANAFEAVHEIDPVPAADAVEEIEVAPAVDSTVDLDAEPAFVPAAPGPWETLIEELDEEKEFTPSPSQELGDAGMDDEIIETSHPGVDDELVEVEHPDETAKFVSNGTPIDPFHQTAGDDLDSPEPVAKSDEPTADLEEAIIVEPDRGPERSTSPLRFVIEDEEPAAPAPVDEAHFDPREDAVPDENPPTVKNVSPELIEAIVQSVLEKMSDRAVREVAREAVPRIAETLIREAIDEKKET